MPIDITMPRLSDTMERGTIIKWNVAEGDEVSAGDVIADVETDKATMEMQVYEDGIVAKLLVDEGTTSEVGTVIAVLAEAGEEPAEIAAGAGARHGAKAKSPPPAPADERHRKDSGRDDGAAAAAKAGESAPPAPATTHAETGAPAPDHNGKLKVSPVARLLAEEHGIDLRSVEGSGPGGRIIKRDILKAVETGQETVSAVPPSAIARAEPAQAERRSAAMPVVAAAAGPTLQEQIVPVSNMRQTIARRLVESKATVPHYQVTYTFDMDPLLEMRRQLNEQLASHDVKLSVNDFLVKCCAVAMYDHPYFNASWQGDSILIHGAINIGMAISIPPERGGGLVVGVIRHADQKSLRAISAESRYLAEKARTRGLSLEEMSDSTFTLSNLGMFGVEHFTAIINPPNSAILAVGAAIEKPVVRDGQLAVGREMSATLSSDHRVIDGAMAAQYLASLRKYIEQPAALLV